MSGQSLIVGRGRGGRLSHWRNSTRRLDRCAFDNALGRSKACSTMKNLSSSVVASLLAVAVTVGAAPVFASASDAQPQCGDDKKESKGGDKKDDKSSDTKPKPPVQG